MPGVQKSETALWLVFRADPRHTDQRKGTTVLVDKALVDIAIGISNSKIKIPVLGYSGLKS